MTPIVALAIGIAVGNLAAIGPSLSGSPSPPGREEVAVWGLASAAFSLAMAAVALVRPRPHEARQKLTLLALIAAGVTVAFLRIAVAPLPGSDLSRAMRQTGNGTWDATVLRVGADQGGQRAELLLQLPDGQIPVAARLPRYPEVRTGQVVRVAGQLGPLPATAYGAQARRAGLLGWLRVGSLHLLVSGGGPTSWIADARYGAATALGRVLPEPQAGLAAGILLGLREAVARDVAAAFTTAGVSHIVAISGWNVAIVAGALTRLLRRAPRRLRIGATAATVALYAVATGGSPSVLRAAAMALVVLLAGELGLRAAAGDALAWAAAVLLLADPRAVTDPGFQLSVLATGGLIAWAGPLESWLARGLPLLPPLFRANLAVSLAAQLATLPVVIATFGRLSLVAPLTNLIVVPLVPPSMAAGLAALGGGILAASGTPGGPVGTALAVPAWLLFGAVIFVSQAAASFPFAALDLPPPANLVVGGAIGAGLATFLARGRARRRSPSVARGWIVVPPASPPESDPRARGSPGPPGWLTGRSLASIVGLAVGSPRWLGRQGLPPSRSHQPMGPLVRLSGLGIAVVLATGGVALAHRPPGVLRVTVLDVGQGDAILLEGPNGGRLLIDGGPDPHRLLERLDSRFPPWDRRLDVVLLSHPHEDHDGGLPGLVGRYRVGRVLETGVPGPGPGYAAWEEAVATARLPRGRLATGDRLSFDGVELRVLWPDPIAVAAGPVDEGRGINDLSIVLLGHYGRQFFLLPGDAEEPIDPILVARGIPHLDLLKVAHHGSGTASTADFLATARPRIAVVSVGAGNPYGHPSAATLARLGRAGARVLRTDHDGSVTVTLTGDEATVVAEKTRLGREEWATPGPGAATTLAEAPSARVAWERPVGLQPAGVPWEGPVGLRPEAPAGVAWEAPAMATPTASPPPGLGAVPDPVRFRELQPMTVHYHPIDGPLVAPGCHPPPGIPRSPTLVLAPFGGRGRGCCLVGPEGQGRGPPRRRLGRRGSRPPPRRGQAPSPRRARRSPPSRGGDGCLAGAPGPRPPRRSGPVAPGDPPGGSRRSHLAPPRPARGVDRRLRRQASGPASGQSGGTVRRMATSVSPRGSGLDRPPVGEGRGAGNPPLPSPRHPTR